MVAKRFYDVANHYGRVSETPCFPVKTHKKSPQIMFLIRPVLWVGGMFLCVKQVQCVKMALLQGNRALLGPKWVIFGVLRYKNKDRFLRALEVKGHIVLITSKMLGGRFDIFCFFCSGRERRSPRPREGGGRSVFLLKIPGVFNTAGSFEIIY